MMRRLVLLATSLLAVLSLFAAIAPFGAAAPAPAGSVTLLPIAGEMAGSPRGGRLRGDLPGERSSVSGERIGEILATVATRADTCRNPWDSPYYYLWEWAQVRCEASRCELTGSESIEAVAVVWANYGTQASEKPVEVFLYDDDGGFPGQQLWSVETTTTLIEAGGTVLVEYPIDPPIGPIGPGPVWYGHAELAEGPPSSLFDEVIDGTHAASYPPCDGWWVQDLADYLQLLLLADSPAAVDPIPLFDPDRSVRIERLTSPAPSEVRFDLVVPQERPVSLHLLSVEGSTVATLLDRRILSKGRHGLATRVGDLPSGVYFLRLRTPADNRTWKILVLH